MGEERERERDGWRAEMGIDKDNERKRMGAKSRKRASMCRASVLPFQKCVNSVSGFANSVFYRFRFAKFRFLPFQIFKIPFHFFQAVFLL